MDEVKEEPLDGNRCVQCSRLFHKKRREQKFCCRDCAQAHRRLPPAPGPSASEIQEWQERERVRKEATARYLTKKPFRRSVNAALLIGYGLSPDLHHAAYQLGISPATLRKRIQRSRLNLLQPYRRYGPYRPVTVPVGVAPASQ